VAIAGVLAAASVAVLVTVRFGGDLGRLTTPAGRGTPPATAAPSPTPSPSPAPTPDAGASVAVTYYARDPDHLQRVDYTGRQLGTAWTMGAGPRTPPPGPNPIGSVGAVSPDGRYVTTPTADHHVEVVDAQGHRTVLASFAPFGTAWADDSRHLCALSVDGSGAARLTIADLTASPPAERSVPVAGLQHPGSARAVLCSVAADRAVILENLADHPVPDPGDPQAAQVVRLSTGQALGRIAIDPGVGYRFSPDGAYVALVRADQGTSTIVDVATGAALAVEHRAVVGFSADGSRVVENSLFTLRTGDDIGATYVVAWRAGQVVYGRAGHTNQVRWRAGSADVALAVERSSPPGEVGGPFDLVIVPAAAPPIVVPDVLMY